MKILLMVMVLLAISCRTTSLHYSSDESHIEAWDKNLPEFRKEFGIKGWEKPRGGRSWTTEDELAFDKWIETVGTDVMILWDIPADCFDAVIALRWMFALKEGLALKVGGYDSREYRKNPLLMLKKMASAYGTRNAEDLTYEVDMWSKKNYSAGNIYRYPLSDRIGHSFVIKGFEKQDGVFSTLEGPYPAKVTYLKKLYFFNSGRHTDTNGESPDTFRRYYSTKNENGKIKNFINEEAHPSKKDDGTLDWWQCIDRQESLDIWENVRNYAYFNDHRDEILFKDEFANDPCRHNYYWDENKTIATIERQPVFPVGKKIAATICKEIDARNEAVKVGFKKCFVIEGSPPAGDVCTDDLNGDHSTPSRDIKILSKLVIFSSILELATPEEMEAFNRITCGPLNFYPEDYGHQVTKTMPIMSVKYPEYSSMPAPWLYRFTAIYEPEEKPYDPKRSIPERWGCPPSDVDLSCMRSM